MMMIMDKRMAMRVRVKIIKDMMTMASNRLFLLEILVTVTSMYFQQRENIWDNYNPIITRSGSTDYGPCPLPQQLQLPLIQRDFILQRGLPKKQTGYSDT